MWADAVSYDASPPTISTPTYHAGLSCPPSRPAPDRYTLFFAFIFNRSQTVHVVTERTF